MVVVSMQVAHKLTEGELERVKEFDAKVFLFGLYVHTKTVYK